MEKVKVCAYCRVSTNTKDQENSFENQKSYFMREIEKHPKYELVNVYADKGITATSIHKREQFLQMVYDAGINVEAFEYKIEKKDRQQNIYYPSDRQPKFNRIFVKNTSRFARNIDVVDLLRKLREKNVFVDFLDIGKTTENESDFVFIEMLLVFDENESRDKSRKVKFGQQEGMTKGTIMANSKLLGYKKIGRNEMEIEESEAEIVRYIYQNYAEGYGVRRIIDLLNQKGYRTKEGKEFSKSSLTRVLKNEIYKGVLVRNKYTTGTLFVDKRTTPKIKDESEWIIHERKELAIVEEELWEKCQKIRKSKINYERQRGVYHGKSEFAGLIYCDKCKSSYTRNSDKGRNFFNCGLKKSKGIKACENINISQEKLEVVLQVLANGEYYEHIASNIAYIKEELKKELLMYREKLKQDIDYIELEKLQKELEDIDKREDNLIKFIEQATLAAEKIERRLEELYAEKELVQKKIDYIIMEESDILQKIARIEEEIDNLYSYLTESKLTIDEMINEIEKIQVKRASDIKTSTSIFSSIQKSTKILENDKESMGFAINPEEYNYNEEKRIEELNEFHKTIYSDKNIILKFYFKKSISLAYEIGITPNNEIICFKQGNIELYSYR